MQVSAFAARNLKTFIVIPPTKKQNANRLKWLAQLICSEHDLALIEIFSDEYFLRNFKNGSERKSAIDQAIPSWQITPALRQLLSSYTTKTAAFIFIDDFLISGMTALNIALFLHREFPNLIDFYEYPHDKAKIIYKFVCYTIGRVDATPDELIRLPGN